MGRKKKRILLAKIAERSQVVTVETVNDQITDSVTVPVEVVTEVEVSAPVEEPIVAPKPKVVKAVKAR
jgi:hypothetical protein